MKKTLTLSALLLVACPVLAFSQRITPPAKPSTPDASDSYFAQVPFQVQDTAAAHITGAQRNVQRLLSQQARLAKATHELLAAQQSAVEVLQASETPTAIGTVEATANPVDAAPQTLPAPQQLPQEPMAHEFAQPAPSNSPADMPAKSDHRAAAAAPAASDGATAGQVDPFSIEQFRMRAANAPWTEKENRMRHVSDHFSPGGRPFAFPRVTGNPHFFGVDRHQVCDEWGNHCNCSGLLKANTGHLGLPWLRSKDSCDPAEGRPSFWGKRKGCDCDSCR